MQETVAYIGLGANLGEAEKTLRAAVEELVALARASSFTLSSFYSTEPIDSSGPDYTNAVLKLSTPLGAEELLQVLFKVENEHGRVRPAGVINAPRTLDCDLLLYGEEVLTDPHLLVPHPRMHERAFVLVPLCELDADIEIPGKGRAAEYLPLVMHQGLKKIS